MIVVSHDRYFLNRVADLLIVLDGDGRREVIHGNYDTYELMRQSRSRESGSGRQETGVEVRSQRTGRRAGSVSDRRPSASKQVPLPQGARPGSRYCPNREEDRRPRSHDANARGVQGRDPPPRYDEGTRIDQGRPRPPLPALGRGGGTEWLAATGECVHVHFS